jgi:hypothetical protein
VKPKDAADWGLPFVALALSSLDQALAWLCMGLWVLLALWADADDEENVRD